MNFKVKSIDIFEKQARKLIKKYPSLKNELSKLVEDLKVTPDLGHSLGKNCFKIRISIASKGKGKSGGARIITNFLLTEETVYLLTIYDKSAQDTITDKELIELLAFIPL